MVLEVIQREVPTRGIGYLILRDCPEDRLGEALGKGMEKLKKTGAKQVWATSLPEGEPLHPGPVGVWRLTHVHDMVTMERALGPDLPKPTQKFILKPVKKALEEKTYLELVNKAYRDVPNAKTQGQGDLRLPNCRYTLAYQGEQLIGAFCLDLSEKAPQLTTLAVDPELRRLGLGRALLLTALESLGPKAGACSLLVSTANAAAMGLYEQTGFAQTGVVSSWFEVV
ncbi:hypothetical protein CE91St43_10760 [Oscillospiraceae bacterium]|nr:hypothetical protein CE91St43_10760 [Oscillospiraceae bacterium]